MFVCIHVCFYIVLIRSLHVSLHGLWISVLIEFGSKQSNKTLRKINFFGAFVLWLLTASTVVIIVSKWIALVWRKTDFGQSIRPAGNQRNHCVYDSKLPWTRVLERLFGARMTAVIVKIPYPFKYPGLRVMTSK